MIHVSIQKCLIPFSACLVDTGTYSEEIAIYRVHFSKYILVHTFGLASQQLSWCHFRRSVQT